MNGAGVGIQNVGSQRLGRATGHQSEKKVWGRIEEGRSLLTIPLFFGRGVSTFEKEPGEKKRFEIGRFWKAGLPYCAESSKPSEGRDTDKTDNEVYPPRSERSKKEKGAYNKLLKSNFRWT